LHLHGLTTTRPSVLQLAIPSNRRALQIQSPAVEVFYLTPKRYSAPVANFLVRGRALVVYTPEQTICDLLRYAPKFGRELYLEGLKNYLRQHSSHQLVAVAKASGVWTELSRDLEVLAHDQDH
jgi:AbiEi antitoxin C-terminal domain